MTSELALYDYQVVGVKRLISQNLLLGDDVGIGKTVQMVVAMRALNPEHALVVVRKNYRIKCLQEFDKWWPGSNAGIWVGNDNIPKICIVNFEQLPRMLTFNPAPVFEVVVIDEGHKIKNRKADRTHNVKQISRGSRVRWVLTGTPIMNRVDEIWSVLNFLFPDKFKSFWGFVKTYGKAYPGPYGWVIEPQAKDPKAFASFLSHLMLRREKKEVAGHIPSLTEVPVWLEPTAGQRKLIKQMDEEMLVELDNGDIITAANALARAMRGRQAATCPMLMGAADLGCKIPMLIEMCEENDGKLLVFSQWTKCLEIAQQALATSRIKSAIYHGGMTSRRREDILNLWRTSPEIQVLLLTIGAGGESLTLTESCTVVILDESWTPSDNDQAIARAHRETQTLPVTAYRLRTCDSMDVAVAATVERKSSMVEAIYSHVRKQHQQWTPSGKDSGVG